MRAQSAKRKEAKRLRDASEKRNAQESKTTEYYIDYMYAYVGMVC